MMTWQTTWLKCGTNVEDDITCSTDVTRARGSHLTRKGLGRRVRACKWDLATSFTWLDLLEDEQPVSGGFCS